MSRSLARDCGFKRVFEYLFNREFSENTSETENASLSSLEHFEHISQNLNNEEITKLDAELFNENELSYEELEFSKAILNAVKTNFTEINNKILGNLKKDLKLKDIYKLDLAILLVSIAEIDYLNEPIPLSINEAVRLAKKYSTEKSPSFINGVLSSVYNKKN